MLRMKFKNLLYLIPGFLLITACHSTKNISYNSRDYDPSKFEKPDKKVVKEADSVVKEAKKFLGTPYRYGGTTKSGLDCSGLVINAFDVIGIQMPRISSDQAREGKEVRLRDVREGDLVFFRTSGSSINHVGIVENIEKGEIFFIHSSTSKGVMISSLEETYWNKRFVKAVRIL